MILQAAPSRWSFHLDMARVKAWEELYFPSLNSPYVVIRSLPAGGFGLVQWFQGICSHSMIRGFFVKPQVATQI